MKVTKSHVAGIGQSLASRMENARSGFGLGALKVAAIGLGFFGIVGIGGSYLVERVRNTKVRNNKLEVLSQYYRFQVGQALGINPDKVTAKDLELAAQLNPQLQQAVQKVMNEKKDDDRMNGYSSAGMLALGGMIPGASGIAKIGVDLAGAVAGGAVASMFSKDVLEVNDVVEHIDGKLHAGQAITDVDIMMLRAAQDEQWQKDFKEKYKTPFHKMSAQTQQSVMAGMPDLKARAEKDAYALNKGLVSTQSLVMAGPASTSNYAGSVAARTSTRVSFAQAEAARRAAASQAQLS